LTVTFGTYKPALLVDPAARHCGEVVLVDLGLEPHLPAPVVEVVEPSDVHLLTDALPSPSGHKYTRGVVGIRAGSQEYAGAAHLCVAGARAGTAGMIRFVGPERLAQRVVDHAPEVVTARGQVQAWVVGPGGGDDVAAGLGSVLADGLPTVIDASALDHLPDRFTGPVLLKGARTVVVAPDGRTAVNLSGTPWLGTAGAGDVLAGFVGSLLATGLSVFDAARLGAFLHGAAAVAANPGGPITASDVAAALPRVVADFLTGDLGDVRREDWA
ncbi:MAG TPA: ADP/ATP-dependent (S)-NAD(P)H-hydrate dehydratase, partial [Aeromicrobium sp.]|nr:ADP/ATP-dependent (S)-NAD(P)H-hydrate dehydratase [Aeromicrobium sp.]